MWFSQSSFPLVLRISLTLWLTQVRVKCKQTSISKIYQCSNDCTGSSIGKDFNTWPINTEQIIYRRLTTLSKCNLTLAFGFGVFPAQGCVWGSKLKCDSYFYRDKHLGQFHRLFFFRPISSFLFWSLDQKIHWSVVNLCVLSDRFRRAFRTRAMSIEKTKCAWSTIERICVLAWKNTRVRNSSPCLILLLEC